MLPQEQCRGDWSGGAAGNLAFRNLLFGSISLIPVALLIFVQLIDRTPSTSDAANFMANMPIKNLVAAQPFSGAKLLMFWLEINRTVFLPRAGNKIFPSTSPAGHKAKYQQIMNSDALPRSSFR